MKRRIALATAVGTLAIARFAAPGEPKSIQVSGWGGHALSDSVSAVWLNGPADGDRTAPLILVYFRGTPGWHKRKWDISTRFAEAPAWIRLSSPDLVLSIEFESERVAVQGETVDLQKANVYLVSPVADPASRPKLAGLGRVSLDMPPHATPPLVVFERNPELKRQVLGDSGDAAEHAHPRG